MTTENDHPSEPSVAFHAAFLAWQKAMPRIDKLRQGHHYRYVGLSELLNAVLPVLAANDLTLHHSTSVRDGTFVVRAVLSHTGGRSISTEYPIDLSSVQEAVGAIKVGPKGERRESMNAIQAQGSALTYARRYTTMCILGITDGLDLDAADVSTAPHTGPELGPGPWDAECAEWVSKIEDAGGCRRQPEAVERGDEEDGGGNGEHQPPLVCVQRQAHGGGAEVQAPPGRAVGSRLVSGIDYVGMERMLKSLHARHPDLQRQVRELCSGPPQPDVAAGKATEIAKREGKITTEAAVWIGVYFTLFDDTPWGPPPDGEDDLPEF